MDFHALQQKLFEMDPTDPREDLAKLQAQASGGAVQAPQTPTPVVESVEVPEGSLQMDKNYSLDDFAALAGVAPTTNKVAQPVVESVPTAPVVDKDARIAQLEERVARLEELLEGKTAKKPATPNPVAKHMNTYNKPSVVPDKKKDAKSGKVKHKSMQYESVREELEAKLREFEAKRK
jgi:hypothetical protein